MARSAPEVQAFTESPYGAELRQGSGEQLFDPALEGEYSRSRLLHHRTLIRIASLLGVLIPILRMVENTVGGWPGGPYSHFLPPIAGSILLTSVVMAWIAWSSAFEHWYLPVARILVPARNVIAAAPIAVVTAQGHLEMLMVLPVMLIGPFFFLGLSFRTALTSAVLTSTAFIASAVFLELPLPVMARACTFLFLTGIACVIAARELEKSARKSFLEGRLIAELAQHDALTGTKNRRVFDEHLTRLWRQAIDDRRSFAIVLVDVDHFKAYNDRYGHQAGDQTLRRVAQTLQTFVCRPLDVLARYGGEEFAAILYDIEGGQAADIADRMRHAVSTLGIEHRGSRTASTVTISVGVATVRPSNDRNIRGALQLADEALYKAKTGGRNRIEVAGQAEYGQLVTGIFSTNALKPAR